MPRRLCRLGGEFFWVAAGQGLVAAAGLVGVRLLTQVLPPSAYGELALAMTIVTFIQVTLQQPLFEAARRYFHSATQAGEAREFLAAMGRLAHRTNLLLVAAAALVSIGLLAAGLDHWLGLVGAGSAVGLLTSWSLTFNGVLNASRRRALIAGLDGFQQSLRFICAATLVWWFGPSSSLAMSGYAIAASLVLGFQRRAVHQTLPKTIPTTIDSLGAQHRWKARIARYGWPFAVWGAALTLQTASARWSLQFFQAAEIVGFSAVLYQVGHYPVALLVGSLSKFLSPVMFNRAGEHSGSEGTRQALGLGRLLVASALGVTFIATGTAWFSHEWIFALLVAPEYRVVSWLLPAQVLASGLLVAAQVASLLPMVSADSEGLLKPKLVSAGLGTMLNILGAWLLGLAGVVYASVIYGAISYLWIARVSSFYRFDFPSVRKTFQE